MPLGMEVGLGPRRIQLDDDPVPPQKRGQSSPPPQFSAHVCCGQTAVWIKMPLDMEMQGFGPGHIVLDGDPAFPQLPKGVESPLFGPYLLWANGWMDQDATWYGVYVDLSPGHIVLDGDPAPPPKGAQPPQFSAHVCCGQTVAWIKMSFATEVGLGTGYTSVRWGSSSA